MCGCGPSLLPIEPRQLAPDTLPERVEVRIQQLLDGEARLGRGDRPGSKLSDFAQASNVFRRDGPVRRAWTGHSSHSEQGAGAERRERGQTRRALNADRRATEWQTAQRVSKHKENVLRCAAKTLATLATRRDTDSLDGTGSERRGQLVDVHVDVQRCRREDGAWFNPISRGVRSGPALAPETGTA